MMPYMQKELVVSLEDIQCVGIQCQYCGARVILDMQAKVTREMFSPQRCPGCGKDYDSAITNNLDDLRRVYTAMVPRARWITLRGKPQDASTQDRQAEVGMSHL